jgi:flagellar biosynthesis protein FliR
MDIPGGVDWVWFAGHAGTCVLLLSRVLGLCLTAPGLAVPGLAWRFRLVLAALVGMALVPVVATQVRPPEWPNATYIVLAEALTGGLLGWSAGLIVAGARFAGELVAAQAGLSTATLFDFETGEDLTPLGHLYGWVALAAFLAMDGPMVLIRSLVESYAVVPVGGLVTWDGAAEVAFDQVGRALALALRVAAPPAIALVMTGIVLGWLGRTAAALPIVALSLPIRTLLGIFLVFLSLSGLFLSLAGTWGRL